MPKLNVIKLFLSIFHVMITAPEYSKTTHSRITYLARKNKKRRLTKEIKK